jgi:hypothetical protein
MKRVAVLLALAATGTTNAENSTFEPPAEPPRLTARAATAAVVVDGRLDEPDWLAAPATAGFVQIEPQQGQPAAEGTTVRVLFDDEHLYFGFDCLDSAGRVGVRSPDFGRDFDSESFDHVTVVLDAFSDGRSAQVFAVTPFGVQRDLETAENGTRLDEDWNAAWTARAHFTPTGWSAEIAIPWQSLRYPPTAGEWGVNFVRRLRRTDEYSGWSPWPRAYSPYRLAYAGRLAGLSAPPPGRNLGFQPYGLFRAERRTGEVESNDDDFELGGELKWRPTPQTVVDVTANTDFAQVEVDRRVVNLGRFSVFFPEKRPFFLESSALFDNGYFDVKPFFSRRIGLDDGGRPIAIDGGLRVVHQNADRAFGGLLIQTRERGETPRSQFAVARYSENFGERNRLGGSVVARRDTGGRLGRDDDEHLTLSLDGHYQPREDFWVQGVVSRTDSTFGDPGWAVAGWIAHETNRGYLGLLEEVITEDYQPAVGFVADTNLIGTSPAGSLDWRPTWLPEGVRKLTPGFVSYLYHRYDDRSFREGLFRLRPIDIWFDSGASVWAWWEPNWQRLDDAFSPLRGLEVESGDYDTVRWGAAAQTDPSAKLYGRVSWTTGGFFDGELDTWNLSTRVSPSPRLALSVDYQRNEITRLGRTRGDRTTELVTPELRLAWSPRLQFTVLYQHDSAAELDLWNARLDWEIRPLSHLYLVLGHDAPTDPRRGVLLRPDVTARQVILKWSGWWQL